VEGRIIDVSYAAAKVIGLLGSGTACAELYKAEGYIPPSKTMSDGNVAKRETKGDYQNGQILPGMLIPPGKSGQIVCKVQVASFSVQNNAKAAYERLRFSGLDVAYERSGSYIRVILPEVPLPYLEPILRRLSELGFPGVIYSKYVRP
jgi:hypothetical protein